MHQSTPFDNFLHTGPCPALGTAGDEAKKRQLKRGATLRWFRETQARKVLQDDGAFPSWLHGMISRRWVGGQLLEKLEGVGPSCPGHELLPVSAMCLGPGRMSWASRTRTTPLEAVMLGMPGPHCSAS